MSKRFEPHRRLLTTLIGSNLYATPDVCIRELLQNSWDAIQLRKINYDGNGGEIIIRYSAKDGWFEVVDDGVGMDKNTIEQCFFEIGQDKLEVLKITNPASQIGYFGIGILSIFLLADKFEVSTKSIIDSEPALQFSVFDIDEIVEFKPFDQGEPGTRIRVYPKQTSNFSLSSMLDVVQSYARHVPNITLFSLDDNTEQTVLEQWNTENLLDTLEITGIDEIRSGRFGFLPTLRKNSGTLENQITICNVGFRVEEVVADLILPTTFGIGGEIDLYPSALTIGMSRDRFQRDHLWKILGTSLTKYIVESAISTLSNGALSSTEEFDTDEVKRNLLLWFHFLPPEQPFSKLYNLLDNRIYCTVPFNEAERNSTSLEDLEKNILEMGKLYFRQKTPVGQKRENIDDEGLPIRFYNEIRDSVRIAALRAKGFRVIDFDYHQVNIKAGNTVQTVTISEQSLVLKSLTRRRLNMTNIVDAPDIDLDMRSVEKLPILRNALTAAGNFTFAAVPDSKRRVIVDQSGMRYINLLNPKIQDLLTVVPDAVSNPLKHKLMEAYLKLEEYKISDARNILVDLLKCNNIETLASGDMAPLTKEFVSRRIDELLQELEL